MTNIKLDRGLFAVYKAKAMAYDCLETDGSSITIKDPAKFVRRSAVAYVMQERYKNRDNIFSRR